MVGAEFPEGAWPRAAVAESKHNTQNIVFIATPHVWRKFLTKPAVSLQTVMAVRQDASQSGDSKEPVVKATTAEQITKGQHAG